MYKEKREKEKSVCDKFKYLYEYSKIKLDSEQRREDSIIQQSNQMQVAFSFLIAAIFMIAPIVIEYRGSLSLIFFLFSLSSIVVALLFSLVFAMLAQSRKKKTTFQDIDVFRDYMYCHENEFEEEAQRQKYLVNVCAEVQKAQVKINDKRVIWIRMSMWAFYIAIALCTFWFIVGVCKIL